MFINYLKIAFRNLRKRKLYTLLNISGLALGMTVAILTGLWLYDELSFNGYNSNYDRVALLQKNKTYGGTIHTETSNSIPLGASLREDFGADLKRVVVSSYGGERVLKSGETSIVRRGYFMEDGGQEILDLKIIRGFTSWPVDPTTLLLSESLAKQLFGEENPVGRIISVDQKVSLKVAAVYRDIPRNSTFRNVAFYGSLKTLEGMEEWVRESVSDWKADSFPVYVLLADHADVKTVSRKIEDLAWKRTGDESRPRLFLHPMSDWHLYPEFKDGVKQGKGLQSMVSFGLIGFFVLVLAAINFMNLSTASSETRAREVGVRKAVGSDRGQLIGQFYTETFITVVISGGLALLTTILALPWFNQAAEKSMRILWDNPFFWLPFVVFIFFTGVLSGSYPALYLSSFSPLKALKGKLRTNRLELFSRKGLVVFQFCISVSLIIAVIVVNRQVRHAQNRPMGYDRNGLIQIRKNSPNLSGHFFAMREELHQSGAVMEMSEANGPLSEWWHSNTGLGWRGKAPGSNQEFVTLTVTPEFGKTIDWNVVSGRDFNRSFALDTSAMILNRTAARLMGFEDPVNEIVRVDDKQYRVVGLTEDVVMDSPYDPVRPTVFMMRKANLPFITIRLNPSLSASAAVGRVEKVLKQFDPEGNFNVKFADTEFGQKFWRENRIVEFTGVFSVLAVLISLLGIFGLATFLAEQKTKEIGVRKVLGATVFQLWALLTREFIALIGIALIIGAPLSWFVLEKWLQGFDYRTVISWWIFPVCGGITVLLTLFAVSFQAIKAALTNPVRSLRSE